MQKSKKLLSVLLALVMAVTMIPAISVTLTAQAEDISTWDGSIPPRDGHPCLRLTVPAAKPAVDFHHQAVAHAGHTNPAPRTVRFAAPGRFIKVFL